MKLFFSMLAGFAISTSVLAQNTLQYESICVNGDTLLEVVAEFDETPSLTMKSIRETRRGTAEYRAVLFINYKTKTWTLAERVSADRFCVVATGEDVAPFVDKK